MGTETPFHFFCDFDETLARAVDAGRRRAFARLARYPDALVRTALADPNDGATFHACKLDWLELRRSGHARWHGYVRTLLALRRAQVVPHLDSLREPGHFERSRTDLLRVGWPLARGLLLQLVAHLPSDPFAATVDLGGESGDPLYEVSPNPRRPAANWSARWTIARTLSRDGES
jgi:maltooligosyltrehalose trehalohydrolase